MTDGLKIKPKFRDLIPPLSTHERQQLRDNIVEDEQIRDPIITWRGWIVDGHNRYEIAEEEGLEYEIEEWYFHDEAQVVEWILKNQLGRRNLHPDDASAIRGRLYNNAKQDGPGRPDKCPQSEGISDTGRTAAKVAKETGVSKATVERDGKYAKALDSLAPPVRDAIQSKDVKATKADVKALAEFDKQSQKQIVASVQSGEVSSLKEALQLADPEPEEETLDQVELAIHQAPEFDAKAREVSALIKWVETHAGTASGHLLKTEGKRLISDLKNARNAIKFCKPHASCPYCDGQVTGDSVDACPSCKGRGWVNRQSYEMAPKELRA